MKKPVLSFLLAVMATVGIRAQSVGPATLNAAGGNTTVSAGEFEWSVGEMTMVSTFTGSGIVVTQGVLQPAEVTEGVPDKAILTQLQVFPNPATSEVNVQYASQTRGTLACTLLDAAGRLVKKQTIPFSAGTTVGRVDLTGLANATYMLEVTVNTQNTSSQKVTYKIQKLQ